MQSAYHARSLRLLPKLAFTITIGLITTVVSYQAATADVFTDPVGFYQLPANTNADTLAVVPFTQIDQYRGVVGSVSGNVITDAGTPGWTAGQWMYNPPANHSTYYAIFTTGANAGAYYIVTNNAAGSLSVELAPTTLASVSPGDNYRIYPFWTLGTLFPNGQGVVPSPSVAQKKTEVLFPAIGTPGINLSAAATFFFLQTASVTNWVVTTNASVSANDQIILPDQYITIRQQNGAATTTNVTLGAVPEYPVQVPLYTQTGASQDNFIGLYRPASQNIAQSGLSNSFVLSSAAIHRDELLVIPSGTVENPSAAGTFYLVAAAPPDSGWRCISCAAGDAGSSNVFNVGTGVIIRKVATNVVSTVLWNNQQNY